MEGYIPAPEDWLVDQQVEFLASQNLAQPESAEHMITDDSTASASAAHPLDNTRDSLSRLALDDVDTPGNPNAHAQTSVGCNVTSDGTLLAAKGVATSDAADEHAARHPAAQSAAAPHSSRQAASASTSAAAGSIMRAAMPAVRIESTGMMASIPAPQGRHIRYDSTEVDSDSEGRPVQASPSSARAGPSQSGCCQLNSIDQQALLDAVASFDTPACNSSNRVTGDVGAVSDAVIEDAMQGVLATTVVTPAELQQVTQASSTQAGAPDAPPVGHTPALTQSDLAFDSSLGTEASGALSSETNQAASHGDSMQPAATPDPLAGSVGIDLAGGSGAQQKDHCTTLEASPLFLLVSCRGCLRVLVSVHACISFIIVAQPCTLAKSSSRG